MPSCAPQATEMNAVAISGPFGRTIATRSPRPMPSEFSFATVASASSRRPPKLSVGRSGARIAGGLGGMRLEEVPNGLGHGVLGSCLGNTRDVAGT